METIKFTACKQLAFEDKYHAKKEMILICGETKICWNRPVTPPLPQLVQFCKKRGRLNFPEMCVCEKNKGCNDYEEIEHEIDLDKVAT